MVFAVFLFSCNSILATIVKGTVKDEMGLPLYYVTVFVTGTNLGAHTNEKGEYQLLTEKVYKDIGEGLIRF